MAIGAGAVIGMIIAALMFVVVVPADPGGGSGNGRYGPVWGFVGNCIGGIAAGGIGVWVARRIVPSGPDG